MNVSLWIAQATIASSFIWAATMKLTQPADQLAEMWPWTGNHLILVKLTGIFDLLLGMGLILPSIFQILPKLTIYAAYGAILLMIAAGIFHISRAELSQIALNIFMAGLAFFIAWKK